MTDCVAKVGTDRTLRNDRIRKPALLIQCCTLGPTYESFLRSPGLKRVLQHNRPLAVILWRWR